jgi:hypothetical protein
VNARTCRPIAEHTFCGAPYEEHGLHGGVSVCPVLSENGQWVDPESEEAE